MINELYTIPLRTITGDMVTLAPYQHRVLLIVNVASRCGFTSQYKQLEDLYCDYKAKGLTILGFPSNQFLYQEPGSNEEINTFATHCFNVTFPLFEKIKVRGTGQSPLYSYLEKHIQRKSFPFIPWNFTKILVDKEGNVLQRYLPTTSFQKIRKVIEVLLSDMV